jgi:hypothetical protein
VTARLDQRFPFFKLNRDVAVDNESAVNVNAEITQDLATELLSVD